MLTSWSLFLMALSYVAIYGMPVVCFVLCCDLYALRVKSRLRWIFLVLSCVHVFALQCCVCVRCRVRACVLQSGRSGSRLHCLFVVRCVFAGIGEIPIIYSFSLLSLTGAVFWSAL